jgi:hypothetical protein
MEVGKNVWVQIQDILAQQQKKTHIKNNFEIYEIEFANI